MKRKAEPDAVGGEEKAKKHKGEHEGGDAKSHVWIAGHHLNLFRQQEDPPVTGICIKLQEGDDYKQKAQECYNDMMSKVFKSLWEDRQEGFCDAIWEFPDPIAQYGMKELVDPDADDDAYFVAKVLFPNGSKTEIELAALEKRFSKDIGNKLVAEYRHSLKAAGD
jgi:hypothetical protein